jgi:hypothetical protein
VLPTHQRLPEPDRQAAMTDVASRSRATVYRLTVGRSADNSGQMRSRYYASAMLRVTAGSTGMPGPVVVETTTFFR